jgi:hypothetical protein
MKTACILAMFSLFIITANVIASDIKCEKGFVSVGDAKAMLLLRCGEPLDKSVRDDTSGSKHGFSTKQIEEWIYITDGFVRKVTIVNGTVHSVETVGIR